MKTQIRRLIGDDPSTRVYFSRQELTEKIAVGMRGMDIPECAPECPVLDALLKIPGVNGVEVHPYHVVVARVPVYEWDEIEPSVLQLLTSFNMGEGRLEEVSE